MAKDGWQLTLGQRFTYSVGMFSSAIVTATVAQWVLYYYAPPPNAVDQGMVFLAAGIAVGVARLLGSLVDALTNPLVAFWSDRSRSPKGRRIPFIVRGTLPLVVCAALVWFPPVRGTSMWNVAWLAVTLSGTWFFYTYVVAPYLALMPEITAHPDERVSLTVTMAYWEAGATLVGAIAIPPVLDTLRGGVQLGPLFLSDGFKLTAIALAIIGGIGFFVSVSRVREKKLAAESITEFSLGRSVVECFRNPAFPPYLFAVSSAKIAMGLVVISLPFLAKAVLHKGEGFLAVLMAPFFLSVLVGFVVGQVVVNRIGLKRAFQISTLVATLVVLGFFGTYFAGGEGAPLTGAVVLPNGDRALRFGGDPSAAFAVPEPQAPLVETGGTTVVTLTALEWEALFRDTDLEAFRTTLAALSDAEAAALLRPDRVADRPADAGKAWIAKEGPDVLATQLVPSAAALLFDGPLGGPKERVDDEERLFLGAPALVGELAAGAPVVLEADVASVVLPAETFNLDNWTMMLSSAEERAAMGPVARPAVGTRERVRVEGAVRYADGSVVFGGFRLTGASGSALAQRLGNEELLNTLVARFDLRLERAWSVRIWLVLLLCFVLGFPAAVLMSMYRPMVCEIVDLDEQRVGTRREAIYFGVEGFLTKSADGITAILAPAVMLLGHVFLPPPFGYVLPFAVGAVFMLLAYVLFGKYPLGQKTVAPPASSSSSDIAR